MCGVRGGEILRTNGEEFAVFQRERDSVLCTRPHIMSIIIISIVKSNKMLIRRYTQLQEMDMVNVVTKLLKEGMVIIVIYSWGCTYTVSFHGNSSFWHACITVCSWQWYVLVILKPI